MEDLTKQEHQRDIINQISRHVTQDTKATGALLLSDIVPEYRTGFIQLCNLLHETLITVNLMLDSKIE